MEEKKKKGTEEHAEATPNTSPKTTQENSRPGMSSRYEDERLFLRKILRYSAGSGFCNGPVNVCNSKIP